MWSQYGENHRGICLVFSRAAILEQLKGRSDTFRWYEHRDVWYMTSGDSLRAALTAKGGQLITEGVEKYCAQHIQAYHRDLFLTKHVDYRDEAEYRFIIADPGNKNEFIDVSPALRGVIAGDATPEVYFSLITELSKKYGVQCRRADWYLGEADLLLLEEREDA